MKTNRLINSNLLRNLSKRLSGSAALASPRQRNAELRVLPIRSGSHPSLAESLQTERLQDSGKRVRRILVPLDGTPFAEHAIPLALGIAEQCDALLQLAHVLVPTEVLPPFEFLHAPEARLKELKSRQDKYLTEVTDRITATALVRVSSEVINGVEVTDALHETYGSTADLVVMATHGRGAFGRFWWGSVAHSLLQRTSVPVILVQGSDEKASIVPRPIEQLLLPLSGDEQSAKVVNSLLELGIFPHANHTLLHVVRPEPRLVPYLDRVRTEWVPSPGREAAGTEYLRPLSETLTECGRQARTRIVSSEKPVWEAVANQVRDSQREVIACSYRRARLLERLVWPGMSERLFREVTCPLMLVPR